MLWSDSQLVRRTLGGDDGAFSKLHGRHIARVYNLLRRLTANEDAAADLAQETFLAAFRSLAAWRHEGAFSTWLCGIAFRLYRGKRRSDARSATEPLDEAHCVADSGSDPLARCERKEAMRRIETAIVGLPPNCREAFVLVRVEGLSYAEAAAWLDTPVGTVHSRLARATSLLRLSLAEGAACDGDMVSSRLAARNKETTDAL